MSSQRLGVKISRFFNGLEIPQSGSAPPRNEENTSPQNQSTNSIPSDQPTSATLSILKGISNSTRGPSSQKQSNILIAEDNAERRLLDNSTTATPLGSWYQDASNTKQSPTCSYETSAEFDTMKLREISGNEGRSPPPTSSPLVRQLNGRGLDLRKRSLGGSEYTEHIEKQLQQVKEAIHSPNTGKPLQEKVRVLQAENRQLKETLSDLEETFDERVKQAVEHKTAVEVAMRIKIKALEDELVLKENTISRLQHDRDEPKSDVGSIDALLVMIKRLELERKSLEKASRVIERRNETLTGLLAQSPTRTHHDFETASPIRQDLRRIPRPISTMIPKTSSSPGSENYQRPQSVQPSPTQSSTDYLKTNTALSFENYHPRNAAIQTDPRKASKSESLDSGIGDSCSVRSPAKGGSSRSSMASYASASSSAWGLPLPASPFSEKAKAKQNKHRRTRRFESGSTQLKPLLLPAMAAEGNVLQTFHTAAFHSSPTYREFSEQSLDPTTSFLSQPLETPIRVPAMPSEWVSAEALKALEGFDDAVARDFYKLDPSADQNDNVHEAYVQESHPPTFIDDTIIEQDITTLLNHPESRAPGEQTISSLNSKALSTAEDQESTWSNEQDLTLSNRQSSSAAEPEIQHATDNGLDSKYRPHCQAPANCSQRVMPQPLFLPSAPDRYTGLSSVISGRASLILLSGSVDDSPVPRKRQRSSNPDSCSFVMPTLCINPAHDATSHARCLSNTNLDSFKASTDTGPNLRGNKRESRRQSPLEMLHKRTASPIPVPSVTIHTIFGTLSRYTSYVREMRRDPIALARRVIANTWQYNWNRLGKLSWWVLGLFLGPGVITEQLDHDNSTRRDWDQYDGEAIAEEVRVLEIRATEQMRNVSSQQPMLGASDLESAGSDLGYRTAGTQTKPQPTITQDDQKWQKENPGWRKSLYLWGKFSIAIMLAVGGAVINGPEEMLRDCTKHIPKNITPTIPEQPACGTPNREVPEEQQHTPTGATDTSVTGMSQLSNAKKILVHVTDFQRPAEDANTHYPLYY